MNNIIMAASCICTYRKFIPSFIFLIIGLHFNVEISMMIPVTKFHPQLALIGLIITVVPK